ncbi:MAG: hypothetical protein QMD04_12905 [Anaerolineales bacterium]|nr:hypothetical protein [Anaerolineales bacterium]
MLLPGLARQGRQGKLWGERSSPPGLGAGGRGAESLFRDGLCLPSGSNLSEADLARVVGIVRLMAR